MKEFKDGPTRPEQSLWGYGLRQPLKVGSAGESDCEGAKDLLEKLKKGWNKGQFLTLYADGGYRGDVFKGWISKKAVLQGRIAQRGEFVVLAKR